MRCCQAGVKARGFSSSALPILWKVACGTVPCTDLEGTAAQERDFTTLVWFFSLFQRVGNQSNMEACSTFLSFERFESQILQARWCFHIALGKETQLSSKSKASCQLFSPPITRCKALHTAWDRKPASCPQRWLTALQGLLHELPVCCKVTKKQLGERFLFPF